MNFRTVAEYLMREQLPAPWLTPFASKHWRYDRYDMQSPDWARTYKRSTPAGARNLSYKHGIWGPRILENDGGAVFRFTPASTDDRRHDGLRWDLRFLAPAGFHLAPEAPNASVSWLRLPDWRTPMLAFRSWLALQPDEYVDLWDVQERFEDICRAFSPEPEPPRLLLPERR